MNSKYNNWENSYCINFYENGTAELTGSYYRDQGTYEVNNNGMVYISFDECAMYDEGIGSYVLLDDYQYYASFEYYEDRLEGVVFNSYYIDMEPCTWTRW